MVLNHQHSYIRYKKVMGELCYKCSDPHCTHYAPVSLIKDKASLCPNCLQKEVILTREALRRVKPLCIDCRQTKEARQYASAKELVTEVLKNEENTI